MSESKAGRVKLKGIEESALIQLVEYIYTAQIEITEENVQALLPAASLLEVNSVEVRLIDLPYLFDCKPRL